MSDVPPVLLRDVARIAAANLDSFSAMTTQVANAVTAATGWGCALHLEPPGSAPIDVQVSTLAPSTSHVDIPVLGPSGPLGTMTIDVDATALDDADRSLLDALAAEIAALTLAASHVHRLQNELAGSRARFDLVMAETPLGLEFIDRDFRVVEVNETLAREIGRTMAECVGHPFAELVPDLWPAVEPHIRSVFETGQAVIGCEVSGSVPIEPGVERHRLASYYPIHDLAGEVRTVGGLVLDITARKRAEQAADLLGQVSQLFARNLDLPGVVKAGAPISVPALADVCAVCLTFPDSQLDCVAMAARNAETGEVTLTDADDCPVDLAPGSFIADQLGAGEPIIFQDIDPANPPPGLERFVTAVEARSAIVVPMRLRVRRRTLGAFVVAHTEHSHLRYREDDLDLASQIAARLAEVIAAVQLADVAARAEARLALLARAATVVESELNVEARAEAVVQLAVPEFADHASLFLLDAAQGVLRFAGGVHRDPAVTDAMHRIDWPDLDLDSPVAPAAAVRGNASVLRRFQPQDGPARLVAAGHPDLAAALDARSVLAVPLRQNDEPLGSLVFATSAAGRRYSEDDMTLAEELARIAAPAIHNALRFEQERMTAETLQRSLLSSELPDTNGIWIAARYLPGTAGLQVGGDWYDVITRDDGVVLAIGDVVGHSIEAAVSMGRFRTVLQFAARQSGNPSRILRRINEFMCDAFPADMATLLVIFYDPLAGKASVASAGHLPPVVRAPDGTTRLVSVRPGLPLCVEAGSRFGVVTLKMEAGSSLVMCTDGLVERRGEVLDQGFDRLKAAVAGPDTDPDSLADRLVADLVPEPGADDDVALLVARVSQADERLDLLLPADAARLRAVRRDLRTWLARFSLPEEAAADVVLSVNEAVANAVEHSYADRAPGRISVQGRRDGHDLVVEVRDEGTWRPPSDDVTRGRGLAMMRGLMDDVVVHRDQSGARVSMRKRLPPIVRGMAE